MKNPLKRRLKYVPPNPSVPSFASEGGGELWKLVLEMYRDMGSIKTEVRILGLVVFGMLAAILARLLGAF